ncbi:pyruvate kinase [Longilinea arvoryzae]|uniref:Pyruvate kinase n=1 Tax=Longilinea arvoryzae TaxID=360412 RepID=A0A0S7BAD8_9CHLR|nr:pyruvate kinase [Longilinea arvoryzae]GAP14471.1 pyruvate kinase [Longilinea arvoryzae]
MTYEIIATLGPASSRSELWREMIAAGVTAFRLNSSHLSTPAVVEWVERLRAFYDQTGRALPVVIDLQGSKWRLGEIEARELAAGQQVRLIRAQSSQRVDVLPVPHADFFTAAPDSSREIRLNDAKVLLEVETIQPDAIQARVVQGGPIAARKGITYAASEFRSEGMNEKDCAILHDTRQYPFVRYAISYVKNAAEMAAYRKRIGATIYLVAKLERGLAVREAEAIAAEADELWLCRGDLGAELGLAEMAKTAHHFSTRVRDLPIPVMLAGQVLEHMNGQPTPTRSEVCCLYDALARGYQGFVLSDEAAVGQFPVESCRMAALFEAELF